MTPRASTSVPCSPPPAAPTTHHPVSTMLRGRPRRERSGPAEWYATEEGVQLTALDADAVGLAAVAEWAEDAVRQQSELMTALSGAWGGAGAAAALDFIGRHQQAAAVTAE